MRNYPKHILKNPQLKKAIERGDFTQYERHLEKKERGNVKELLKKDKQQIKQALKDWDSLSDSEFRAIVKKLFKILITNEIKE